MATSVDSYFEQENRFLHLQYNTLKTYTETHTGCKCILNSQLPSLKMLLPGKQSNNGSNLF